MSEKIALVTDSSCDLPAEVIEKHGIHILPLRVIYGTTEYRDIYDISPQAVYDRMPAEVPTTSQPAYGDIRELWARLKNEGFTKILAIHISSGLSGTFQLVRSISQDFPAMETRVIDSKSLSMGLGFLVYEAARNIARGLNLQRITENLRAKQETLRLYYVLETLEYLRRGGRIGLVASTLGGMLDIKPIISVNEEGKYFTFCKVRGRKKSIDKIVEVVEKAINGKKVIAAVMHGGAPLEGEALKKRIENLSSDSILEVLFGQISPVLGVHTGPGLLGVCFYEP